jgi:general stress protein 26
MRQRLTKSKLVRWRVSIVKSAASANHRADNDGTSIIRRVMSETDFWKKVHETAGKLTWAYLATAKGGQPKVRVVHPGFEGEKVWIATGPTSAKAKQIAKNPNVELFYSVGTEFTHLTVTGGARMVTDQKEKDRVWNAKIFDYDLTQFWPKGSSSPDFSLMLVTPRRVELTSMPAMMQGQKPEVWKAR